MSRPMPSVHRWHVTCAPSSEVQQGPILDYLRAAPSRIPSTSCLSGGRSCSEYLDGSRTTITFLLDKRMRWFATQCGAYSPPRKVRMASRHAAATLV